MASFRVVNTQYLAWLGSTWHIGPAQQGFASSESESEHNDIAKYSSYLKGGNRGTGEKINFKQQRFSKKLQNDWEQNTQRPKTKKQKQKKHLSLCSAAQTWVEFWPTGSQSWTTVENIEPQGCNFMSNPSKKGYIQRISYLWILWNQRNDF